MLVEMFITMRDGSMQTMHTLDDMVKTMLRLFPNWLDCYVYTTQEPPELSLFSGAVRLPLRRLHNCVVKSA